MMLPPAVPPAVPPAAAGCPRPTRPSSAGSSGPFSGSSQKPPFALRSPDGAEADSPGSITDLLPSLCTSYLGVSIWVQSSRTERDAPVVVHR